MSNATTVRPEIACAVCGEIFVPRARTHRFCSKKCAYWHSNHVGSRPCSIDGCDRGSMAKGLCMMHYMAAVPPEKRHRRADTQCAVCGITIERRVSNRFQPTCSPDCRKIVQFGPSAGAGYDWIKTAMRRAKRNGVTVIERIDRLVVFDRDGWECYCCHRVVSLDLDCFEDLAATVDHIVPFSKGGQHVMSNVATCCFKCNSAKQAAIDTEWEDVTCQDQLRSPLISAGAAMHR